MYWIIFSPKSTFRLYMEDTCQKSCIYMHTSLHKNAYTKEENDVLTFEQKGGQN